MSAIATTTPARGRVATGILQILRLQLRLRLDRRSRSRQRLLTWALVPALLASVGANLSFYLLLSVVPLYATSVGAGAGSAGLVTGTLMLSTVMAELVTPRLVARFGYRLVLAAGLVLVGAPALALPAAHGMAAITAVSVVRGAGLATLFVAGGALTAALLPGDRRGEGLGLIGLVAGVPGVVALPLGVWLAGQVGYTPVFVAGALAALAPLVAAAGLPTQVSSPDPAPAADTGAPLGVLAGLRTPSLVRPAVVFAATAMASGAVVTFLPATAHASGTLVAAALLIQSTATTVSRWWAGRHGDRHGPARLLLPAGLLVAAGLLGMALPANPLATLAGAALFGAGFGIAQNASLALMFQQAPASAYGTVSAVWNLAYDAGLGLGAAGFGLLAAHTGIPTSFVVTAAAILATLGLARQGRTGRSPPEGQGC